MTTSGARIRLSRRAAALVLVAIAGALASCDDTAPSNVTSAPVTSTAVVAGPAAPAPVARHLSPADFEAAIHQTGVVLVDVRTPAEFAAGHIAGALNVDVQATDFLQRMTSRDHAAPYALYCHSGNRSAVAMSTMLSAGFTDVVDLAGGVTAWMASGRALAA